MFDLEKAIATWRASLTWKRSIDKQDRDELERHIRDAVEDGVREGMSEEDAFRSAIRRMGQLPQIDKEYRKIYWGKLRKRRRLGDELAWRAAMLKNYFTIALRLLIKQRIYAVINIFGLAVGIAFCLLLLLYVQDELTFDDSHEEGERIARVITVRYAPDGSAESAHPYTPFPLGKALEAEITSIEAATRLMNREVFVRSGSATTEEDVLFQVNPTRVSDAVALIKAEWETFAPEVPFTYSFLDDDLGAQYESEQRWTRIVRYASFFAILIAALGLFGLASLSVTSRTKEIGIRRVLGATTVGIAAQLSKGFVQLVLVGVVLAVPLTWTFANRWLDSFAYRIDISLVVFVIAALLAVGVALITVGLQTVRAAGMNPVDSIRVE